MSMGVKSILIASFVFCLALVLVLPACGPTPSQPEPTVPPATTSPGAISVPSQQPPTQPAQSQTRPVTPPPATAPTGAIKVSLTISEPPVLGKPVQVTATFTLRDEFKRDAPNTVAEIMLREGFELVDGNLKWAGDLLRGASIEIKATVKTVKIGSCSMLARASAFTEAGKYYTGGGAELHAWVSENSAEVSEAPLGPKPGDIPTGEGSSPPPSPQPPVQDVPPPKGTPFSSSSISPESGELLFIDELRIFGGFECWISENSLPSSGSPRDDEPDKPIF